jgi:hypothetical protein
MITRDRMASNPGFCSGDDAKPAALDAQARRAAERLGLKAKRSRWRAGTSDNRGGFQILNPHRNRIIVGEKFELSAEDVIAFCGERSR